MRIYVKVKPGARKNQIVKKEDGYFIVSVTAAPEKGKANKAIIELLADYFKMAKSEVRIISGLAARNKVVEIINK